MINIGELQMINIVEPQLERGDTQFSEEIETANPRPDDRNGLRGASIRHRFPPVDWLKSLAACCRDYAASGTGSIKLGSLFLTLPTQVLTGQQVISSAG
jgi:hypothetical protein